MFFYYRKNYQISIYPPVLEAPQMISVSCSLEQKTAIKTKTVSFLKACKMITEDASNNKEPRS